jgi:L-methionine (R)-S-oxide reductase
MKSGGTGPLTSQDQAQEQAAILTWLEGATDLQTRQSELLQQTVDRIHTRLPTYNWVGFYMLDPTDSSMLELGPFAGAPTPHTRIPVTQGICGAAVAQGETVVVDDVNADPRYLSCSIETKSEIVVPIRAHGQIVGEIDIDSHTPAAFGLPDRTFVERCAAIIGGFLESVSQSKSVSQSRTAAASGIISK